MGSNISPSGAWCRLRSKGEFHKHHYSAYCLLMGSSSYPSILSISFWFCIYSHIVSSFTFPTDATKYPLDQKCLFPLLLYSGYLSNSIMVLFLFKYDIISDMLYFEINTIWCMQFYHICCIL